MPSLYVSSCRTVVMRMLDQPFFIPHFAPNSNIFVVGFLHKWRPCAANKNVTKFSQNDCHHNNNNLTMSTRRSCSIKSTSSSRRHRITSTSTCIDIGLVAPTICHVCHDNEQKLLNGQVRKNLKKKCVNGHGCCEVTATTIYESTTRHGKY